MVTRSDPRLKEFEEQYLPELVRRFQPDRVIAFGSRVRGEPLRHSDLDLLVVAQAFEKVRWLDRSVRVVEALGIPFGVDLLCYTPEEYESKMAELGIVRTATAEGRTLFRKGQG
ncbi:MAG: nucleotidyltransferase domain-containing protein [Gemmatimonadota bacterium]